MNSEKANYKGISCIGKNLIFENNYARIEIFKDNFFVKSVYDKVNQKEILGEETSFFSLFSDNETKILPEIIDFSGNVFTLKTKSGSFDLSVGVNETHFVFEILSDFPSDVYKANVAHIKYDYDFSNKKNAGAIGIAMTWWANPMFYPDAKAKESCFEVLYKKSQNAKYALIIAPIEKHRDIIKEVNTSIDRNDGIVNERGGVYSQECEMNYGNIITDFNSSPSWLNDNIPYYKSMGVDIIDYHKNFFGNDLTFRQGDFKPLAYESQEEFKKNVSDVLKKHSMYTMLHTYAHYIDYDCDTLLSDVNKQKDLKILKTYTLDCDIQDDDAFIRISEDTYDLTSEDAFFDRNTPFFLVGNEIIKFEKNDDGIKILKRGVAGTKMVVHEKGEKIHQLAGEFYCISTVPGSELFFEVARLTAKAYNEGGYEGMYIDAIDGLWYETENESECKFYASAFMYELLKHCKKMPILDDSATHPGLWATRSHAPCWDTPYRGYKEFNKLHIQNGKKFMDMYLTPAMGWYNFYGIDEKWPENFEIRYLHTDAVEHLGSLSVMYNCNMTYVEFKREMYDTIPALRRNIAIYKRYDELRKKKYFSENILEKLRNGKYEYHINENNIFTEKDYQVKKLYDICDDNRNIAVFNNPFLKQKPFIRIEALFSCDSTMEGRVILPIDKNVDISEKDNSVVYDKADFSKVLAQKVSVLGNGKKGALAIKLRCQNGIYRDYAEYIIDTDFEGWRDFIVIETDSGERPDLPFDEKDYYATYRRSCEHDKIIGVEVETAGDVSGVRMSDVVAYPHTYETFVNPCVKVGDNVIIFLCNLKSGEYIEFDGKTAKVIDKIGNEREISYKGEILSPEGEFSAQLLCENQNKNMLRAQITFGFTGKEIE